MIDVKQLFRLKSKASQNYDEALDVIPDYSLGRDINAPRGSFALLSPFRKTISISSAQKNEGGHSGLLVLGWGGAGKTVLANAIAHEALSAGQKVIRYYGHEIECKSSFEGTQSYTDAKNFDEALTDLLSSESCDPTVIIVDCVESYLMKSVRFGSYSSDEAGEKLNNLIALKSEIEKRFPDKVLFVFVSNTCISSDSLSLLISNVGLTVTGKIYAHHKIGELLRGHPSRDFYLISQLRVGEFAVIQKEIAVFRSFAVPKD